MAHSPADSASGAPSRLYGGVAAEERRVQRHQRFIEAGIQVFGTRGLAHSTMRDLCAEARLTDRYFYESFRRLEDVFEAVHAQLTANLVERLSAAMFAAPLQMDALAEAGLRAFFSFMREDPRRARILLIDAVALRFSTLRNADDTIDNQADDAYVGLLRSLYNTLYPDAAGIDLDIPLLAKTLIGMTIHAGAVWAHDGFDKSLDDIIKYNLFAWRGLDGWIRTMIAERDAGNQPKG